MDNGAPQWLPFIFPFLFVGMWFGISALLGLMSGWFNLRQWYPDDGDEEPLLKLRGQSAMMGAGVSLNNALTLRAYPSGLGIGMWRLLAPLQKPLRVPWGEIAAEPSRSFFVPMVKLYLGRPANGTLKINARTWSRIVAAAGPAASGILSDVPPVDRSAIGRAMAAQWLVITAVAGAALAIPAHSGGNGLPWGATFALVAVPFGIAQLIRFARS